MTAFARVEAENLSWEIRSVNQRYLDVSFRMPETFRNVEMQLREMVRKKIHRGKIECSLRLSQHNQSSDLNINQVLLQKLRSAIQQIDAEADSSIQPAALELLRWPGVVMDGDEQTEEQHALIKSSFNTAISELTAMRAREGQGLREIVLAQLENLAEIVAEVRAEAPEIMKVQRSRLLTRISQLEVEVDTGRLEQELVFFAQKADVAEELDRLATHIIEIRSTFETKGPIGRRLDFLMQELNREANTLSSKASVARTSLQSVDLKVIIEQMREQIQNIE